MLPIQTWDLDQTLFKRRRLPNDVTYNKRRFNKSQERNSPKKNTSVENRLHQTTTTFKNNGITDIKIRTPMWKKRNQMALNKLGHK